jgi:DNA-binding NarL/FixJ family response regulator
MGVKLAGSSQTARFVGRLEEIAFFEARLDDALRRDGSLTFVYGEAGIGKTRLLGVLAEEARSRGFRVGSAACLSFTNEPYGTLAEALRGLVKSEPRALPKAAAERALLTDFVGLATPEHDTPGSPWQKRRLLVVVREFLERLSTYTPALLRIDDAQWLDPESTELLQYLAPQLGGFRVVLVVAARPEARSPGGVLESAAAALEARPGVYVTLLKGLSTAETRELLYAALPSDQLMARARIDDLCRRSEGNPLFAEGLLDALLGHSTGTLPSSVDQSVRTRLALLTPLDVRCLETAAIAGSAIDATALEELCGLSAEEVAALLRDARNAGLIVDDGVAGPRFRHELIREALLGPMSSVERMAIHRQLALRLETRAEPSLPAELAAHWLGAGNLEKGAAYAEIAGDDAASKFAFASARDQYESVLALGVIDPATRARVCEKLASAHDVLGSAAESYRRLTEAAAYAQSCGDRSRLADLSMRLANAAYRQSDADATIRHCEEALAMAEPNSAGRFTASVLLATFWAYREDTSRALSYLETAEATAGPREPLAVVRYNIARATVAFLQDEIDAWRSASEEAISAAESHGDPAILANCLSHFADYARFRGEVEAADRAFMRAITVADEFALGYSAAYARIASADQAFVSGETARARQLIREAYAIRPEGGLLHFYVCAVGLPIAVATEDAFLLERLADEKLLDSTLSGPSPEDAAALTDAWVTMLEARGQHAPATALISRTLARMTDGVYVLGALLTFARFADRSDLPRIAELVSTDIGPNRLIFYAQSLLIRAIVAGRTGDSAVQRTFAAKARSAASDANAKLLEALAAEWEGDVEAARDIFANIGALHELKRLDNRSVAPKKRSPSALTRRESEIASLVASGLSNRAIAERLTLSDRTVEHHISSVFSKLEMRSRAELAAFMALASA